MMTTQAKRAERLRRASDLLANAQAVLWTEIGEQCRSGHAEEVAAALGLSVASVYRKLQRFRVAQGGALDGRQSRWED